VKVFDKGHGQGAVEYKLGKYGFVRFQLGSITIDIQKTPDGYLRIHADGFGGVMKVLPRVANEVYIGIEKR
jgi:hypothetical protein